MEGIDIKRRNRRKNNADSFRRRDYDSYEDQDFYDYDDSDSYDSYDDYDQFEDRDSYNDYDTYEDYDYSDDDFYQEDAVEEANNKSLWQQFIGWIKHAWKYYKGGKTLVFFGLLLVTLMSSYLLIIAKTTNVSLLQDALRSQTTFYSVDDQAVGSSSLQKGNYVELDQISDTMKETLVATEDKRFYEHSGFDVIGMGRAFVRLLINRDTSGGGGSTITQQLVKNAFLTQDQTLNRKLKELFLAIEVEKHYTKDQILEMYLNHAYFGQGVWGVEDATQKYFGHSAATLDWNESMVLTGMLKGPSLYNPIDDYEAAIDRRDTVCDVVKNQGLITDEEANQVKNSQIYLEDTYTYETDYKYPSYFDAAINEVLEETNIPEDDLLTKGYQIYTYLDEDYQTQLDASYDNNEWLFPDNGEEAEPLVQSASVVVDPETGGVSAIYGGRGEYVYRGFNRATSMKRAPGSTIKPLAVYTLALEKGYKIDSMVPDVVKSYGNNNYTPENYDRQTDPDGEVPLYYALAQSKNTTAVHLMDEIGIQPAISKLKQFGIEVPEEDHNLTLALGALSQGVSPLQLASAYAAFANDGVRMDSYLVRRVEDVNGKVIYSREKPSKHMVMTKKVAENMTSMMLDTYGGYGTSYGAGPDFGQIAGKSGSTEISERDMRTRDRWLVGYTPDFVIVTWLGLDKEDGGESSDDLMPTGLGQLFNIQTTNLMAVSNQTPFNVQQASLRTSEDTTIDLGDGFEGFQEEASEFLGEVADKIKINASKAWDFIKEKFNELVGN